MPTDDEWRRQALAHCLRIAAVDPEYAQWAADQAERDSGGVLAGLGEKVRRAIEKHRRKEAASEPHESKQRGRGGA